MAGWFAVAWAQTASQVPGAAANGAQAPACLTQAQMSAAQRSEVGGAAYRLAAAILGDHAEAVQKDTIEQFASNFGATGDLIHATAPRLGGDTLAVTQLYLLDASARTARDSSAVDFSCPLAGTAAETDFSIGGLPPGRYAFAMVEASGPHPWLLSFLLQSDVGSWKLAGFYPHAREAAGHSGTWYWTMARADAKSGKPWLAWVMYGEADALLRPASFASSTNLDRLRSERHGVAPPTLSSGISDSTPLALTGPNGTEYRITGLNAEGSEDGRQLNLVVHVEQAGATDSNAETARNLAAATALLAAHPELRSGFDNLWVVAEAPGTSPFVTERPMPEIPAPK